MRKIYFLFKINRIFFSEEIIFADFISFSLEKKNDIVFKVTCFCTVNRFFMAVTIAIGAVALPEFSINKSDLNRSFTLTVQHSHLISHRIVCVCAKFRKLNGIWNVVCVCVRLFILSLLIVTEFHHVLDPNESRLLRKTIELP